MKPGKILSMVEYFCLNMFKLSTFETGCAMLCCFILVVSCLTTTTARVASLHYGALQWHAAPSRMPNEACDHILCVSIREAHGHLPSSIFHKCWTFSSSLFTKPHRINTWGAWKGVRQRSRENRVASSPTSSQQKFRRFLCAKKNLSTKRFQKKWGKWKEFIQFFGGLRPGDYWFLTNLSQPIRNLPNSLVTCHLKKWDFSGNEVPPTKHQSWGTKHQRKTTEKIIKSTS